MLQIKEQDYRKQHLLKTEISNSPNKGFKVKITKVIKMLTKLRRWTNTVRISTEVENMRKFQKEVKELKNTIIKLKHIL